MVRNKNPVMWKGPETQQKRRCHLPGANGATGSQASQSVESIENS